MIKNNPNYKASNKDILNMQGIYSKTWLPENTKTQGYKFIGNGIVFVYNV